MSREDYEVVIGLEVHCELSTKTKIFCSCPNDFSGEPNTHCCPVCLAMPGALPVLNKKVIEYAVKAGLATNCTISNNCKMDRKNYFYPDTPRAYQISQFDIPLCSNGYVMIDTENGEKKIRLLRIHIEDDAGKLIHDDYGRGSFVNLNRAGVPLIECVSEPDLRSKEEAESYLRKLKSIFEYIGISDCKMQEGSFRADVNVSVRKKGETKFGTRTEMKNMSSFRSITRAIEYESNRQIDIIENGGTIYQESLKWDDISGKTFSMRDKENADDYRYFPEPDLVPIKLSNEFIEKIKNELPELPETLRKRYIEEYKLISKAANFVTSSKYFSDLFEETIKICNNPKTAGNIIMSDIARILNENCSEPNDIPFSGKELGELILLIDNGTISTAISKKVLEELFNNPISPKEIVEKNGWIQNSNEDEIKEIVLMILKNNESSVNDYKAGKERALGFLVGQVMKETKGKANPQIINKLLLNELKK